MSLTDITDTPLPQLPPRRADSHKGDYGRALLVGGSRGMAGAIALAGQATLRSGAGLVTLAVPRSIQDVVAGYGACYMTLGLDETNGQVTKQATGEVLNAETSATAIAIGPGLGRSVGAVEFANYFYQIGDRPKIFDADALFALAEYPPALNRPGGARILTPHPGEFARITGKRYDDSRRTESAAEFVRNIAEGASAAGKTTSEIVLVLKGHRTVITDGQWYCTNQTGNPGMATGGSGDVLTGVITGLLCQGLSPFDAARLGVHVHGLAGDLAAAELGQVSLIASDLIEYLPKAFQSLRS
ncbi:MAG TPA: NAD(P)H-hydrate dehydratase [Lacipirellulaceae bacterium]|jgi:NAD(P)H-hydrate epimerase|nr:NAD(P)H-hydrate dehydratase [Lacipirellulaceae bacterium]